MRKQQFLYELKKRLSGLPAKEAAERLNFYSEMIDDKIEDGLSEEEAIRDIGTTESVAAEILAEAPVITATAERNKSRLGAMGVIFLILGSPIWLSLIVAAFAVAISLYAVLWSVIIALWAVFVSFVAAGPAGVLAGIIFALCDNVLPGIATAGAGLLLAGLAILIFFGCKAATIGSISLTKWSVLQMERLFVRK